MEREIASYNDPKERMYKAFLLRHSINQRMQEWIAEYPIRKKRHSRIVAISDMVKNHIAEHFGLNPGSIDVVYNGVDTQRFRPSGTTPEGPLKVLFFAGNFRLKGLLPLLLAIGEVSKRGKDCQLSIMGRGRREHHEQVIRDLNIGDSVAFLGEQSLPEAIYRDAHILVHPTFYDACSLTTMEAMASGLPTITTRWNGASALLSADEGFVIDEPYDIPAIVNAIRLLFDEGCWAGMVQKARQKLESYTIERNAMEMERILREARQS